MLGDPTRLRLLLCIKAAGPISVSDLAVAAELNDVTVSQTLRFLRAHQTVTTERDGRVIRYQLATRSSGTCSTGSRRSREPPGQGLVAN